MMIIYSVWSVHQLLLPQPYFFEMSTNIKLHEGFDDWTVFMAAICNRAGHIYFHPVVCSFFLCSPNLSRRRLDVYHTCTHGVALVRISDAVLKCAARGSLQIQDAKCRQKSPSGHHRTTLLGYIFTTKARIDNRKKLVKQQYLLHMLPQYRELRPTSGWDRRGSLGHPCKFQRVSRLGSVTARHSSIGVSQTLRRSTEGATYIRQGGHHVGHWPTF